MTIGSFTTHMLRCDRCGREKNKREVVPDTNGWRKLEFSNRAIDLCPWCRDSFDTWLDATKPVVIPSDYAHQSSPFHERADIYVDAPLRTGRTSLAVHLHRLLIANGFHETRITSGHVAQYDFPVQQLARPIVIHEGRPVAVSEESKT